MTWAIAEQEAGIGLSCTEHLPKGELIAITGALAVLVVASTGLFFTRWRSAVAPSLALSVCLVVAWIAVGGFGAFDCVLDV